MLSTNDTATRVMLDRRISEEGLIALDPPFEAPDWLGAACHRSPVPIAFVMQVDGAVSRRWQVADEVDWTRAVAVRLDQPWGEPATITFDDDCYY